MVNLIVADDHAVLREALCDMLSSKGGYKVLAQASNGDELLKALETHKADVVIMDLTMPHLDGVAVLERLSNNSSQTPPILVLSANENEQSVRAALKAGAKGYVPKSAGLDELEFAISSLVEGKTYLSPAVTETLMNGKSSERANEDKLSVLSPREIEIMTHLADGKPNRDIAKLLHISIRTVDTHRSNILKKLNLKTNSELTKLAIASGLIRV